MIVGGGFLVQDWSWPEKGRLNVIVVVAYFWGLHHCKGHGCFKTSYKVFLGWLDFRVCNICLPVSFEFPLCYYVMLLTVL